MTSLPRVTLGFVLSDAARLFRKRFEQNARGLGLTRAQWQVLAYLARNEGIQQSALADMLEIEAITLGRIVDRLESADLVERRRHPADRRIWQLYLRKAAHPLIERMWEIGDATRAEALRGLSAADRETLLRNLVEMRGNLVEACNMPIAETKVTHG
jgi:DNA-binding MarR family transcriptional regulator